MEDAFEIKDYAKGCHVIFKKGSVLTPELIISAIDYKNTHHEVEGRYDLWDFRGCHVSDGFNYAAMQRVASFLEDKYSHLYSTKVAILIDETDLFGLGRMFETLMDNYPTEFSVFKDAEEARQWLMSENRIIYKR